MSHLSAEPGVRGVAPFAASPAPCASAPVLISDQQVVFSTAAARHAPPHRRRRITTLVATFGRFLGGLLEPRPYYPRCEPYLEAARMSREMDRL